jgi:hypothetical protein
VTRKQTVPEWGRLQAQEVERLTAALAEAQRERDEAQRATQSWLKEEAVWKEHEADLIRERDDSHDRYMQLAELVFGEDAADEDHDDIYKLFVRVVEQSADLQPAAARVAALESVIEQVLACEPIRCDQCVSEMRSALDTGGEHRG